MNKAVVTAIYLALTAWIVTILPTACDTEYDREHPVYISDSDQFLIDSFQGDSNE